MDIRILRVKCVHKRPETITQSVRHMKQHSFVMVYIMHYIDLLRFVMVSICIYIHVRIYMYVPVHCTNALVKDAII